MNELHIFKDFMDYMFFYPIYYILVFNYGFLLTGNNLNQIFLLLNNLINLIKLFV